MSTKELKSAFLCEMVALLKQENSPISFENEIITVVDPEVDDGYDNKVGINGIELDENGEVLATGDIYDDGNWIDTAEPVQAKLLSCEELETILDSAKRSIGERANRNCPGTITA